MRDNFQSDAESFFREINNEDYLVSAGLKDELALTPIYERYAHLFTSEITREAISQASDKPRRHLAEFVTLNHLEQTVKALTEEITNAMLKATVDWEGERIPYHNLRMLIANEANMERRHRLDELYRETTAGANDKREERWRVLHAETAELGFANYLALCDRLRALNITWLSAQIQTLLKQTEIPYFNRLEFYLDKLQVPEAKARSADLLHLFRAPQFDPVFPKDRLLPTLQETLLGLGIDIKRQTNLGLDTEPRPLKSPRAFCAAIIVPDEVKLVIKPKGGRDDYSSLFHEAGHAQHFAHARSDLPLVYRRLGDNSVTESFAFLFEYLLLNRQWLDHILGLENGKDYRSLALFHKVFFLRRYGSKLLYEKELHTDMADAQGKYASILGGNLGVNIGTENYLDDVDDAFYCAQYLRAWVLEVQLRRHLEERFGGQWFRAEQAGQYLIDLWHHGQEFNAEEIAQDLGYDGLDIASLLEELTSPS